MIEFENGFVCLKDEKGFWSENWDCAGEEIDSLIGRENETPVQADITARYHTQVRQSCNCHLGGDAKQQWCCFCKVYRF